MNKCLILLTNYYPFHKGEEYLETEIIYLSQTFDEIFVVPTMVNKNMKITRSLPDNVSLIKIYSPQGIKNKLANFLITLPSIIQHPKQLKRIIHDVEGFNFYKYLYNLYFEARTTKIFKNLSKDNRLPKDNNKNNIYIYSYWFYITANLGIKLKYKHYKNPEMPLISRGHGYDVNDYIKPFNFLPLRNAMLNEIDYLYPVSLKSRDYLRIKYSNYSNKIDTRRLGVFEGNLRLPNRKVFTIVSCSTVRKLKRIDIIIETLALLEEKKIKFKWYHVGNGPQFDEINSMAKKKLKKDSFEFVGSIPNNEVRAFYKMKEANLFINTSESEGVPVSIMEAMSYSIPVIASNVGGTDEIVKNKYNGYIVNDFKNPKVIANLIQDLIEMPEGSYQSYCKAAYETWHIDWNADKLYKKFANELI